MKNKSMQLYILLWLSTASLVTMPGCGSNDLSKQDQMKATLISAAWKIQSVKVDGVDKTNIYPNLMLAFTATDYITTNGLPVWPASGTWAFTDDTATAFIRNDGLVITIREATATILNLELTWSKTTLNGHASSVAGQHAFSFIKQ